MSVISRNEILGKAVLTVGGTFIGRGREILLDTRTLPPRVAAVLMEGDLDHPGRAVAWDHVRSVGRDAVMVDEVPQTAAQAVPDPAMVALTCDECRLIGKNVVRDDGQVIGRVDDVSFETQSGRLASLHMSSGALSDFFHRLGGSWGGAGASGEPDPQHRRRRRGGGRHGTGRRPDGPDRPDHPHRAPPGVRAAIVPLPTRPPAEDDPCSDRVRMRFKPSAMPAASVPASCRA